MKIGKYWTLKKIPYLSKEMLKDQGQISLPHHPVRFLSTLAFNNDWQFHFIPVVEWILEEVLICHPILPRSSFLNLTLKIWNWSTFAEVIVKMLKAAYFLRRRRSINIKFSSPLTTFSGSTLSMPEIPSLWTRPQCCLFCDEIVRSCIMKYL